MVVVVASFLSRFENRWARALFAAAVLTAVWGVARLVLSAAVVMVVGVVGLIAVSVLVLNQSMVSGSLGYLMLVLLAWLVSVFTVIGAFHAASDLDLRAKGTRHIVTVVGERTVWPRGQKGPHWQYTLYEGGVALPGELDTITHEFKPGQDIVVYSRGDEHRLADELDHGDLALGAKVGYLISLPLWLVTGYFAPTRKRTRRGLPARVDP